MDNRVNMDDRTTRANRAKINNRANMDNRAKDPAHINAALVIHLPLPIYNVRGASLH